MRRLALGLAGTALALSACGSTVQVQGQSSLGGDGLGQPGLVGGTTTGGGSATAGGAMPGGSTGAAAPGATGGPGATVAPGGTGGGVPAVAKPRPAVPGMATKKPVEVGVIVFPDVNEAAAALGGSADVGDQKGQAEAAIAWINAHGGLAGHKVVPVYFEVSLTSSQSYAQTYQQICAKFTQDHHVVATVLIGNAEPGLPSCLQKGKSLFLGHGHYVYTAEQYAQLPLFVAPEDAGSDRIARAMVKEILGRQLLKRGETLGLLVMDYAGPQKAKDKIIVPAMKAAGIDVLSYTIAYPQSTPAIAQSASAVQSAQLAMAARGVKNVAFVCPGCVTFFLQYAESQAYYPRYIVSSLDTLTGIKGKGKGRSFGNALAIGWDPIRDVGAYADAGLLASNPTFKLCRAIESKHIRSDTTLFAAVAFCGAFQSLLAAANANPTEDVSGASLAAGFNALGTSFAAAANLGTRLAPDQHDGVTAYRTLHYASGCDCFAYDSGTARPLT